MADNLNTTNLSIKRLCHDWRVALARLNLESLEGQDDDATDAACDRANNRTEELFVQIEATEPQSSKDLFALLTLARDIWKESSAQRHEVDEKRALVMLQKAIMGLKDDPRADGENRSARRRVLELEQPKNKH